MEKKHRRTEKEPAQSPLGKLRIKRTGKTKQGKKNRPAETRRAQKKGEAKDTTQQKVTGRHGGGQRRTRRSHPDGE